jgi:hypothetical protein
MSQGFREFAKLGLSGTSGKNVRFTLTTSAGTQLGEPIVKAIDGVDVAQTVGSASSVHYLELQLQVGAVEWTNTTASAWSASKIRVEVFVTAVSDYRQIGTITFAPSGQTVGINFKISFSSLRFTYADRAGLSTLMSNTGYSSSKSYLYEALTSGGSYLNQVIRTGTLFLDSGTTAMISSGNTDIVATSNWTSDRVRVSVLSGTYHLIGIATFSSQAVNVNEILRLTNITFTFSVPTT